MSAEQPGRFRLSLPMLLIYRGIQALAWAGLHVYHRRRTVIGREHLRFDGPAIVIVNHPNTLLDVLESCIHIPRPLFFLANYGLFKHPVSRWIFTRLYCIPVKRREDVAEGEARNNDAAFEASFQHLERGGSLFVAPEGVSWMNRFVRPFKTGTARIALGSEARNGWQLGLKIIPVGLTYDAPDKFRSDVVVRAGTPVLVRDWAEKFRQDPAKAVDDLTEHLENQLKTLSIHARDEAGDLFLQQLETLAQTDAPLFGEAKFERSQALAQQFLDGEKPRGAVEAYFSNLKKTGLSDFGVCAAAAPNARVPALRDFLFLLFGLPLTVVGLGFWFLPCFLPWLAARQMKLYVGYDSTVKFLVGLFTFPLAVWGAFRLAAHVSGSSILAAGVCLGLVALGFWLDWAMEIWERFSARRKAMRVFSADVAAKSGLLRLREMVRYGVA